MKKFLRIITLLLALILSLSTFAGCDFGTGSSGEGEGNGEGGGNEGVNTPTATYEYQLNDDEDGIILKKYVGDTTLTEIEVPSTIDGLPVVEIGKNLFFAVSAFKQNLKKVTLPASVTRISSGAFKNCKALTTVNTEKVKTFDISCFEACVKLEKIDFSSATSIGKNSFRECGSLKAITIPSTVKKIEADSFTNCTALTTLNLGSGVKEICEHAFAGCMSLSNVDLSNVQRFNKGAFSDCVALTDVKLDNVVFLAEEVFQNCTALKTAYVGSKCIIIYYTAFYKSYNLKSLSFAPSTIDNKWISVDYNQQNPEVVWSACLNLSAFTDPAANAETFGTASTNWKKDNYYCKKEYMIQNPFGKYVEKAYAHANGTCSCGPKGRATYSFTVDGVVASEGSTFNVKVGQTVQLGMKATWGPNDTPEYHKLTAIRSFIIGQNLVDENVGDATKGFHLTFISPGKTQIKIYSSLNSQERIITFLITA